MAGDGGETGRQEARAHAKVNLRLRVLGPAEDGYHAVETLLLRLRLADRVAIEPGPPGVRLEVRGPGSAPSDSSNLCRRAARAFAETSGIPLALTITLTKEIPVGAGLGGGSSDAAAVLRLLSRRHPEALGGAELERLAGDLGSDVPFGLCPSALALGWERGRRVLPLSPPPPRPVLVLVPDVSIQTAEAYAWLKEARAGAGPATGGSVLPPVAELATWRGIEKVAVNDFEDVVLARHAILEAGLRHLREAGASPALLCGSGSCLFGVFETRAGCDRAAENLGPRHGFRALRTATLG